MQQRTKRIDRRCRPVIDWQYWPDPTSQKQNCAGETQNSDIISRPDIEDDALITWGLAQSEVAKGLDVKVDVLYGEGTGLSGYHIAWTKYCS